LGERVCGTNHEFCGKLCYALLNEFLPIKKAIVFKKFNISFDPSLGLIYQKLLFFIVQMQKIWHKTTSN